MPGEETTDLNVAMEWLERDKSRLDGKKKKKQTLQEERTVEHIWHHTKNPTVGSTKRYRRNFDDIDWSK